MFVPYTHESIRLTGRWDTSSPACAVATATGSYVEFCFDGDMAVARFDIEANMPPLLHLWVQLDGGDRIEAQVDRYLRVCAARPGRHICRIIYKGGTEVSGRWYLPLHGKVTFRGVFACMPVLGTLINNADTMVPVLDNVRARDLAWSSAERHVTLARERDVADLLALRAHALPEFGEAVGDIPLRAVKECLQLIGGRVQREVVEFGAQARVRLIEAGDRLAVELLQRPARGERAQHPLRRGPEAPDIIAVIDKTAD